MQRFVASGYFHTGEKDDIVQSINERLLASRIRSMQARYNHSAYVSTYFAKIVYNLCLEMGRKRKRERALDRSQDVSELEIGYEDESGIVQLLIQSEIRRFETLLKLYGRTRCKLELCLKLFFRVEVTAADLRAYYPQSSPAERDRILASLGANYENLLAVL